MHFVDADHFDGRRNSIGSALGPGGWRRDDCVRGDRGPDMTCPLMDDMTIEQFDYAEPCKDCGKPATAFMQQSHSDGECWSAGSFRCAKCLDKHLRMYALWLIDVQGRYCAKSKDRILGGLEENTKVMPL